MAKDIKINLNILRWRAIQEKVLIADRELSS